MMVHTILSIQVYNSHQPQIPRNICFTLEFIFVQHFNTHLIKNVSPQLSIFFKLFALISLCNGEREKDNVSENVSLLNMSECKADMIQPSIVFTKII